MGYTWLKIQASCFNSLTKAEVYLLAEHMEISASHLDISMSECSRSDRMNLHFLKQLVWEISGITAGFMLEHLDWFLRSDWSRCAHVCVSPQIWHNVYCVINNHEMGFYKTTRARRRASVPQRDPHQPEGRRLRGGRRLQEEEARLQAQVSRSRSRSSCSDWVLFNDVDLLWLKLLFLLTELWWKRDLFQAKDDVSLRYHHNSAIYTISTHVEFMFMLFSGAPCGTWEETEPSYEKESINFTLFDL